MKLLIAMLSIYLLMGCAEEDKNQSKPPAEPEVKEETNSENRQNEEQKSLETEHKDEIYEDTVYGLLDEEGKTKVGEMMYRDELMNTLYLVADGTITQVEANFDEALGLNLEMDKSLLVERAYDYMAADASLIQTKSDTEFVYESKKLGEKYDVLFAKEGEGGAITRVIVSQYLE